MEKQQGAPLQEALGRSQEAFDPRKGLASPQGPSDAAITEAFSFGYSEYSENLTARSVAMYQDLIMVRSPIAFAEAKGGQTGLLDKLFMRRDRLEHAAVIAIVAWAKRFSLDIPVDRVYRALDGSKDSKAAVQQILRDTLYQFPDLTREIKMIIADAHAKATAEGIVASGSVLNQSKKIPVPDLNDQHKLELTKAQKSNDYGADTDATVALILSGLAGDLVIRSGALKNKDATDDQIKDSIVPTIAAGAGAAFYLGETVHANYASGQLAQIADAGEKVDYITAGDTRVCATCAGNEDGNPYTVSTVPPVPQHGGCRCAYHAAGVVK